jgi:3-hydroxymyristoyl/3-hydroxydecanoyl-(acyl carrier protein) dehydratase
MSEQAQWLSIPADHPALPGHFPGNPIVPGVVLLSQVWDAVCRESGAPLHCTGWPSVKFLAPLQPGVPFRVDVEFGAMQSAKFVCRTAAGTIAQGSVRFAPATLSPNSLPEGERDEVSLHEFHVKVEK